MKASAQSTATTGRFMFGLMASSLVAMAGAASAEGQQSMSRQGSDKTSAQEVIQDWPDTSNEVAGKMIEKYGEPDGVTDTMLIWHDNGPWVRTIVHKEEVQHNFPVPHQDVLEQFINYEVPAENFSDLAKYDGSVVAYRTNGEISARCDKEGANILALNLANDIIEGERSIEEARAFYAQTIQQVKQGETPEYVQGLQFEVQTASVTADPDEQFDGRMASSAQSEADTASSTEAASQSGIGQSTSSIASMSAEELRGKNVLSTDGEVVGEVTDVSEEQGEKSVRIELNGFLGIGGREVLLPVSGLSTTAEGDLQTTMSDEELKALPDAGEEEEIIE